MIAPREIPAVDVVTGMTVRVEQRHSGPDGETVETIEGRVYGTANANIQFGNGVTKYLSYDHPVTVLAEPEPELVEGAWYWVEFGSQGRRPMFRDNGLWSVFPGGTGMRYEDDEATVLGRVLIVDWPGDDVARLILDGTGSFTWLDAIKKLGRKVADAIRTQGGVR